MKPENLERASQIHLQRLALNKALTAVKTLREGDKEGVKIVDDFNAIDLVEYNSNFSLELMDCEVGAEILVAIEDILISRVNDLLGEAKNL